MARTPPSAPPAAAQPSSTRSGIRLRRQRLVEAGIKYRHLLHAREQPLCGFHAAQVGVVMQWRQRGNLSDLRDRLFRDQGRLAEEISPVRNAVAN